MKLTKILLAFSFLLMIAISSNAQAPQVADKAKIANGVKNGELTKGETRKLVRQQRHIRRTKREAKSDGVVTAEERRDIHAKKKKADANIYIKKHNNRDRN